MGYHEGMTIIGSVCVVMLLLLAVFFATVRPNLALSNRLFAGFLLLTAADLSSWIAWPGVLDGNAISVVRLSLTFLQMPVLLLYVTSACFADFRLRPAHLWHAVPFLVVLLLLCRVPPAPMAAVLAALHLQFYVYIAAAFWQLWRFRRIFRDNFADPSSRTFAWLFQLCLASTVAHTLLLVKAGAGLGTTSLAQVFNILVPLAALMITVGFAAKALYQPDLFRSVEAQQEPDATSSRARAPASQAELDRLLTHMRTNMPFVDANLSLKKLARQMAMPARDLSELINDGLDQSFFEFVNGYRIDRAADILGDRTHADRSVLDVLYDVGFNSKSSFNTAFKRRTGQTPSDYRRKHMK